MVEVGRKDFWKLWPEVEAAIRNSVFVAIDLELSGLKSNSSVKHSLFDSACERYLKLRRETKGIVATQVGLSAFQYDRQTNTYSSSTYTFHISPQSIGSVQQFCTFEASAFKFFKQNNFDLNKFAYEGVPYLNREEQFVFMRNLADMNIDGDGSFYYIEALLNMLKTVQNWMNTTTEKTLTIQEDGPSLVKFAQNINKIYPKLKVTINDCELILERDCISDVSENKNKVHNDILKHTTGFTNVINLLEEVKKPLVFHNALIDLLIIFNQFVEPLPMRYDSFKNLLNKTFPLIYDSKIMFNDIKHLVKDFKNEQCSENSSLQNIYTFFSATDRGKHIQLGTPFIKMKENFDSTPQFHNAGWDSYSTGFCFLRTSHWMACLNMQTNSILTYTEILSTANKYCNNIYLSRGAQPYLCLDKNDPARDRPQYLYLRLLKNQQINLSQLAHELGQYTTVDVKKYGKKSALVAVATNSGARKLLETFKRNQDMKISKYSVIKHSPIVRMALWSSFILSSSLLALVIIKTQK